MTEYEPAGQSAAFAAHLLRAALGAPGADSPAAGATVLALLVILVSEGETEQASAILGAEPGVPATFEVRTYSEGGLRPEEHRAGLDAAGAMRVVLEQSDAGADLVEAVAVTPGGLARRVVESRRGGQPRYLFPEPANFEGDAESIARAVDRWGAEASGRHAGSSELSVALTRQPPDELPAFDPPQEVIDLLRRTVRQALEEVTVEVDLGAIESVVASALAQLAGEEAAVVGGRAGAAALDGTSALDGAGDRTGGAGGGAGAGGGVERADIERILTAVERPVAPSIDAALAARILEALETQARPALPPAPPVEGPSAARIAEEVAARLVAAGNHQATGDRRGGPGDAGAEAALAGVAERLGAQTALFEDRIRSATRTLEALADDIAADVRGSEDYLGRLTNSVTAVVERVGRRLEGRLEQLPRPPAATDLAAVADRLEALVATLDGRGG